jgi:hypothetical protein
MEKGSPFPFPPQKIQGDEYPFLPTFFLLISKAKEEKWTRT